MRNRDTLKRSLSVCLDDYAILHRSAVIDQSLNATDVRLYAYLVSCSPDSDLDMSLGEYAQLMGYTLAMVRAMFLKLKRAGYIQGGADGLQ